MISLCHTGGQQNHFCIYHRHNTIIYYTVLFTRHHQVSLDRHRLFCRVNEKITAVLRSANSAANKWILNIMDSVILVPEKENAANYDFRKCVWWCFINDQNVLHDLVNESIYLTKWTCAFVVYFTTCAFHKNVLLNIDSMQVTTVSGYRNLMVKRG